MKHYFYLNQSGQQIGPLTFDELREAYISPHTLVWTQGMTDWQPASLMEELAPLFAIPNQTPPPAPQTVVEQPTPPASKPDNYLLQSILVTAIPAVLCGSMLSLLGIVAIIYATQVDNYFKRGKWDEANEASRLARQWTRITFWVSIGWVIVLIVLLIFILISTGVIAYGISDWGGILDSL